MSAGVLNQLSFKKESTWGTAVVPDKSLPVHMTGGVQTDIDLQTVDNAMARLAKSGDAFIGNRVHEGEYEFDLFPDYTAYFLLSALGSVSSALKGGESVVYNHTISEAETKPSLTIEQVVGDNVRRYAGAIASGFKLSAKTGETAVISFPIKAKSQASATKISPTYLTNRPFNFADVAVKIGGSGVVQVVSVELEYKNNIEFLHSLSQSNDAAYNYVKGSEVTGKIEMYLDNTTLTEYTKFLAKTNSTLDIELTGSETIGTGSNHKIAINVPKVFYSTGETEIGEDYNALTVEFTGVYDTSASRLIQVVVTNLLANLN